MSPLFLLVKMSHFRRPACSPVPQSHCPSLSPCFPREVVSRRASWESVPLLNRSPSVLRWRTPSLPRGGTSRSRAVSTFSVKNSSSCANDVWALRSPPSVRVTSPQADEICARRDSASTLPEAFVCRGGCLEKRDL